jgi:hypothetical protein
MPECEDVRTLRATQNDGEDCFAKCAPNDRLANFPTGSKSFKKLCGLCVLSGENLSPNDKVVISERNARSAVELLAMTVNKEELCKS